MNLGSPPPMRGKVRNTVECAATRRITPAHAGKSEHVLSLHKSLRDHPRPCGEKAAAIEVSRLRLGSPPPMRGKGLIASHIPIPRGITPAHAGKRCNDHN